ncbi:hypothetical protein BJ508DRAFT_310742 [Ascobolus immersus RN42]|uniref:Uncharacterized protein n=1 Tax=Ascobolus immersus RN42 TaxID=1160509 RepID=A0A3N4HSX3_ASCIM|nr:hypothetical protein BJ508DRAFT_310742 [Ascobolus immersus RN42]
MRHPSKPTPPSPNQPASEADEVSEEQNHHKSTVASQIDQPLQPDIPSSASPTKPSESTKQPPHPTSSDTIQDDLATLLRTPDLFRHQLRRLNSKERKRAKFLLCIARNKILRSKGRGLLGRQCMDAAVEGVEGVEEFVVMVAGEELGGLFKLTEGRPGQEGWRKWGKGKKVKKGR